MHGWIPPYSKAEGKGALKREKFLVGVRMLLSP
jgi:hypothetical protein